MPRRPSLRLDLLDWRRALKRWFAGAMRDWHRMRRHRLLCKAERIAQSAEPGSYDLAVLLRTRAWSHSARAREWQEQYEKADGA